MQLAPLPNASSSRGGGSSDITVWETAFHHWHGEKGTETAYLILYVASVTLDGLLILYILSGKMYKSAEIVMKMDRS